MANNSINPAGSQNPSDEKDRAKHMTEWEKVRDTMEFFDDKSHDLRKYGFSFVTALLTAEGILIPMQNVVVTAQIKFAIFGVTLLLILAIHLIDRNYRVYQQAANMRGLTLEKELNLEISETITDRYQAAHINLNVNIVYLLFIAGVLFLGWVSLSPEWIYFLFLVVIAALGTAFTIMLRLRFKYRYLEDWTISPLVCDKEGTVRVTLTNFSKPMKNKMLMEQFGKNFKGMKISTPIFFEKDEIAFDIINEETGKKCHSQKAEKQTFIYDSQTWILERDNFGASGMYRIQPRGWPLPLHRRIIVSGDNEIKTVKKS